MAAGTIQVSPVGVTPSRDIFNIIGEKVKKAKDQAVEARQEADQRIKQIEETPDDELTQEDIVELESLKQKRSQKGYFFKKALKFQTTDKIRTTMGKFQRDPELQNDPAATEKERFYAKTGMFRPGEMPDMSSRDEKNKDIISYVGKGFQMIMDAIDKVKVRVNRTAESSEKTSRTASTTESTTENVSKSTENLNNSTESIANTSKAEVNVHQMELRFEQDAETKREQEVAEARAEKQSDVAGTSDVVETDQGVKKQGKGLFSSLLDIGGNFIRRRRFGRRIGNRIPGAGRARLARMRAGRIMNPARRNTQYTAPIGPQPMNSPTPWAAEGGGFAPRMESSTINLSDGGIIAPIKPKKQKKLSDGGITGLISRFLPPPLGPMLNMMINPGGMMKGIGAIGGGIGNAVGGAFQMLTNPTKLIGEGLRAVLPMNRNVGKDIVGGDKSEIENMTKLFQFPTLIGGGIMFGSIAMIAKAIPFLGAIFNAAKPIIKPIIEAFGLPASVLGLIFGGGAANAATMPPNFGPNGNNGPGSGDGDNPAIDDSPVTPSGSLSAAPSGKETGLQSLSGGTPTTISAGSTVSNTQLHHGTEDTRRGLRVRDYFIGGRSGPSDGRDGLGAKLYTPLGFGPLRYKKLDAHGITFHDPQTGQKVGMYYHVDNPQHQLDGKVVSPGTLVGTQGGLPGTPSAYPGSSSVHLHVEGTDKFHNAVIATYAGGNILKSNQSHGNVSPAPNASALAVRQDGSRSGSRSGSSANNKGNGSNTSLSSAANAARSVNNIITNPVGAAADGLLNMFYPSTNK